MQFNNHVVTMRGVYSPFEFGQEVSWPDMYQHEMLGGCYTNLVFYSTQLSLAQSSNMLLPFRRSLLGRCLTLGSADPRGRDS